MVTHMNYSATIAQQLNLGTRQVEKTIELLEQGATVPFIARYRKEVTGSLNEVQITAIRDLLLKLKEIDKRRAAILASIAEQGKLTPELEKQIGEATTMTELEDLYLLYKPKRRTRATMAMERGLEPLANELQKQYSCDVTAMAGKYVNEEKGVKSVEEALAGARDIIAERVSENVQARNKVRNIFRRTAMLSSKVAKDKEEEAGKYESWFDWKENAMRAPSHRILALFRGEEEGLLRVHILPEDDGMNANGNSGGFGGGPGGFGGQPGGFGGERPRTAEGERPAGERPEMPGGERPQVPDENRPSIPEGEPPVMPADAFDGVQQPESSTTEEQETWIHVSGGSITIVNETARDADGLDSNGDIIITGGSIRISLTNSGSNNALDYGSESGGRMIISGGDVIACGSYSMAEGFDSESGQCAMLYNFKRGAAGGTEIRLKDKDGNLLLQYTVPCSFSSIAMSCPEMKQGESYTLEIGDTEDTITLTEVSAAFGDVESRGFGGKMNWGGMQFRPEDRE